MTGIARGLAARKPLRDLADPSATGRTRKAGSALAEAHREVVRLQLPFRLMSHGGARSEWGFLGLTLAQRDRAVEELVAAGVARLVHDRLGITVEPAVGDGP